MSDVFISYVREDAPYAERLANALTSVGWSVFWDRDIIVGARFRSVIAEELASAKAVVVLWSERSINSDWVNEEADEAKTRGVLVPAFISDNIQAPFGFRQLQTARLTEWTGSPQDAAFHRLLLGIRQLSPLGTVSLPALADSTTEDQPTLARETRGTIDKRLRRRIAFASAAVILISAFAYVFLRNSSSGVDKTTASQNSSAPVASTQSAAPPSGVQKHLIALMLEARSFDHMLGFLKNDEPEIDGLRGSESNPDTDGHEVKVSADADYQGQLDPDPSSSFESVQFQVFGGSAESPKQSLMRGFVRNYEGMWHLDHRRSAVVMKGFAPAKLPVLTTLARQFAVADRWFSSVPSSTMANYGFVHYGTSFGKTDMSLSGMFELNRNYPSVYERLASQGRTAKVYYYDSQSPPLGLSLLLRAKPKLFGTFAEFLTDCAQGNLPNYAFVEPNHSDHLGADGSVVVATDQHPDHHVAAGEQFVATVYEAVRRSPLWADSILVILYSNHGGLYDHVVPPATNSPDGLADAVTGFKFDRLGVRVPVVIVSPLIPPGTVDHTIYDHTSLISTARKLFLGDDWQKSFLTKRDQNAKTFDHLLTLKQPRPDAVAFELH